MSKGRILTPEERKALRKAFGELVERRRKIGLSQEDLGFKCSLHRTYIWFNRERGNQPNIGEYCYFGDCSAS